MRPAPVYGLSRASVGLTEAHKKLITLLAERAVADYLAEEQAEAEQQSRQR